MIKEHGHIIKKQIIKKIRIPFSKLKCAFCNNPPEYSLGFHGDETWVCEEHLLSEGIIE